MVRRTWKPALLALLLAGCGGDEADLAPWNPEDTARPTAGGTGDETSGDPADDDDTEDGSGPSTSGGTIGTTSTSGPGTCEPGATQECICADGLSLSTQNCEDDGSAWGPCLMCGDDDTTSGPGESGESTAGEESGGISDQVCYPGADGAYTTCFDLHMLDPMPEGYDYPEALNGQANYRKPVALIDLEEIDLETFISPNFRLREVVRIIHGRYAVVQPRAVASIQNLRDEVGAITVSSGYRSPARNATAGGVVHSRHMYGDGFDLVPSDVSINALEAVCTAQGGMMVEYDSHVHCDYRDDELDEGFFGAASGAPPVRPRFEAELYEQDGVYTTSAVGFDEGEPARRWTAYDEHGRVLEEAKGASFVPPPGTVTVDVRVGTQVELSVRR